MKVLITGATGFIGKSLCNALREAGHTLIALSRNETLAMRRVSSLQQAFSWNPLMPLIQQEAFVGVDAVINLAGETVAGKWNVAKKNAIRDSRVLGTRNLVAGIEALNTKPKVLISANAVGYYGDRGEDILMEDEPPGSDFLATVCRDWEKEANRAQTFGLRVVCLRIGIVLGPQGGVLQAMLPLSKMGLGGPLGSGRQWWSWVHRDDVVGLITYALESELSGPMNATAPEPVRQKRFAGTLGRMLGRPAFLPAPSMVLKVVLGEFSSELLSSKHVLPEGAQKAGFRFRFSELESALKNVLTP